MAYLARGRFRELEAALAAEVKAAQSSDPLQPVTVVVGSALLRAHLVRALAQRLGACANVEVVTLYRLAARLAGDTAGIPLSRLAKERLVARLVGARATRRPWYFAPVAGTPGLGRALLATIEDLREGLVEPGGVAGAASGDDSDEEARSGRALRSVRRRAARCRARRRAGHLPRRHRSPAGWVKARRRGADALRVLRSPPDAGGARACSGGTPVAERVRARACMWRRLLGVVA